MATCQDIVACDICKQEPLQHFCNGCEVRLCKICVVTHLDSGSVEGHIIVPYKYRDARNIQPKVCLNHRSEIKTLYCRGCFEQICVRCIDGHSGHDLIDLKQYVNSQYKEIEKASEYLRIKLLPNCKKSIEKMKLLLEKATTKYDNERQRVCDAGKDLHRKVDEGVDVLLCEINKQKKEALDKLQDLIKSTEARLQDIENAIDMCEATKSSLDDVLKFNFDKSSLDIARTVDVTFPQYRTPSKYTVDVGSLKRIREEKRILDEPYGKNNQSLEWRNQEEDNPRMKSIDSEAVISSPEVSSPAPGEEQSKTLTLFELLDKEEDKDSEEFEEAQQDLVHMFTSKAVLKSTFPQANFLPYVTVKISKPEEVPETVRERALYRYLVKLKPETYEGSYTDIWREYGTMLMAENLLELAMKANGPNRNIYLIVEKRQFYAMQSELQKKTEEVEELSERLSRFTMTQL